MTPRNERLWTRAWSIREGRARGKWLPIIQHLALRGEPHAIIELADWYSGSDGTDLGAAADAFAPAGLYCRALRKGEPRGAYNLAMSHFNRNERGRYRHWLGKAARAGDGAAALQFGHFETRLPHAVARLIGRHRPEAKRDEFG